jgi:hypothetical protein
MSKREVMTSMRNLYSCVSINSNLNCDLVYWRCDEGKGVTINDMTDNEMNT